MSLRFALPYEEDRFRPVFLLPSPFFSVLSPPISSTLAYLPLNTPASTVVLSFSLIFLPSTYPPHLATILPQDAAPRFFWDMPFVDRKLLAGSFSS